MGNVEFDYDRSDALNESRGELYNLHREVASQYTLSKEDFDRDFKWDDFSQWIWNCWMVSALDSFVNFWDYERLIRTHVKKNNKWWYDITLPMWSSEWGLFKLWKRKETYHITREDLLPQVSIEGEKIQLLENGVKKWIHCLIIALWQKLAGRKDSTFDYNVLNWWCEVDVMDVLMSDFYAFEINRDSIWDDSQFNKKLRSYFKKFDKRTDMMTVGVERNGSWENMWKVSGWRWRINHAISVDSVFYEQVEDSFFWERKQMWIRLSNPWDASDTYEIPYSDFKNKCWSFDFWSKKMKKVEDDYAEGWTYEPDEDRIESEYSADPYDSLNGYLQSENWVPLDEDDRDERNLVVKEWYQLPDWRIVSKEEWNGLWEKCFIVESYGKKVIVKKVNWDWYAFSINGNDITFNKSSFLNKIEWVVPKSLLELISCVRWTNNQDSEESRFLASAMLFANFVNYIRKIDCKWLVIMHWELFKKVGLLPYPIDLKMLGFKRNISLSEKTRIVNYINSIV